MTNHRALLRRTAPWLLTLAVVAVFAPTYGYDFCGLDDELYVSRNSYVLEGLTPESIRWAFSNLEAGFWHPLTWLSLMLDATVYGPQPGGFHVTNVLLHLGSTLLLYGALVRTTGRVGPSMLVAALFAVHPLHVESVAWIAERKDVLSAFFGFWAMGAYVRYAQKPTRLRYLAVLLLFLCSLMSKPTLVTLPFALLLWDYWPLGRMPIGSFRSTDATEQSTEAGGDRVPQSASWKRLIVEKLPLIVLTVPFAVVTLYAEGRVGALASVSAFPWRIRVMNAVAVYGLYLQKTIWPARLAAFYPHPGEMLSWGGVAAGGVLLAVVTAIAVHQWRRRPYLPVGWFWYLGTLVPMIGLIQISEFRMADRFTYIPLVGVFLLAVWEADRRLRQAEFARSAAVVIGVLLTVAYGTVAARQVTVWRDDVTLYRHMLAVTDDNAGAHYGLAVALLRRGDRAGAVEQLRRALDLEPEFHKARVQLGLALCESGDFENGMAQFRRVLESRPDDPGARYCLGWALMQLGEVEQARRQFERLERTMPKDLPDLP